MLNDLMIKATKPAEKPMKLYDSRGLYLLVTPAGGKLWRFKYRFSGKERLLALGKYPDLSLKEARNAHMKALLKLSDNHDPAQDKQRRLFETLHGYATPHDFANSLKTASASFYGQAGYCMVAMAGRAAGCLETPPRDHDPPV